MITLVTGMPGGGKTLLAVDEFLRDADKKGRNVVIDGIPDLVLPHTPAPEVATWTIKIPDPSSQDGEKLLFTFPEGSLVVIDECQRIYRPRRAGSSVPPEVAAFETHRHQGLDFVLITQHPGLLDANVRRLVGRHLHVRDLGILGRKVYEWPEATDPEKFRSAPIQRGWRLPKDSFKLYKSSSLHIKPVRGIPKGFMALALLVPLFLAGSFYVYQSVEKKIHPTTTAPVVQAISAPAAEQITPQNNADSLAVAFTPVLPGKPETAPAYDLLRVVKAMPVVVGCVSIGSRCTCLTQQGTDAGLDFGQCREWIAKTPFDPYREPAAEPLKREGGSPATGRGESSYSTVTSSQPSA